MKGSDLKRRLAAILAADAAGYSRLMAADESATVAALDAARAVFRRHIESNQGRVIDMAGDSVLAVFDTAAGAAAAALATQHELEAASRYVAEDHRMRFRVGLHLGDVIEKADGTIYGDGVNIAARLQALAEPGGIRISQIVHETVKSKVPMQATFVGPEQVKNIRDPVLVWEVVPATAAEQGAHSSPLQAPLPPAPRWRSKRWIGTALAIIVVLGVAGAWYAARREAVPEQPVAGTRAPAADAKSIAILPFIDMSEAKNMAYFADGVHEDLLTQLALVSELKVVSRTSVTDYRNTKKNIRQIGSELGVGSLVEGSVRRAGDRVRVSAQLIDAHTDKHLWAKSYDRELKDLFAIQSELATEIAHALKVSLTPRDQSQLERRPTENLEAYELFLRHRQLAVRGASVGNFVPDLSKRIDLLSRAVTLDPKFGLAWAMLGAEEARVRFYLGDPANEHLSRAQSAIDRALGLAPDDLAVRLQLGYVHYYGYQDFARAAQYVEDLLKFAPHHVEMLTQLSYLRRRQGRWADADALLRKALSIDLRNGEAIRALSENLSRFRHYDEVVKLQQRLIDLSPGNLDLVAQLYWAERLKTGSFAGYDAWRKGVPAAEGPKWDAIWIVDVLRALDKRDLETLLRLTESPPWQGKANIGGINVNAFRAAGLLALGRRTEAQALARSKLPHAREDLRKAPLNSQAWDEVLFLLAVLGERNAAHAELRKLRENPRFRSDALFAHNVILREPAILALLGDRERALKALARVGKEPNGGSTLGGSEVSRLDPAFASLWDIPEFLAIVRDPANNSPLPLENRGIPKLSD